jgi:hypothetical protein
MGFQTAVKHGAPPDQAGAPQYFRQIGTAD